MSAVRWEGFLLVYSPLLRFWIRRKLVNPQAEDDILQECMHSIVSGISQFERDPAKGTFRGWLKIIVQRRVADHFRSEPLERPSPQAVFTATPIPDQKEPQDLEAEQQALQDLKIRAMELIRQSTNEKTWEMFWLTTIEGVPTSFVAHQFQVTQDAVRVARSRVKNRIKELLVEDGTI